MFGKGLNSVLLAIAVAAMLLIANASAAQSYSFVAGGTVTQGTRGTLSGATAVTAGVADEDVGTFLASHSTGEKVALISTGDNEVGAYLASGAIAAGVDVYPDSNGLVTATIQGKRIGKALNATTTTGDTVQILRLAPAADRVLVPIHLNASSVDDWVFIADRNYTVVSIREVHTVVGGSGAQANLRCVLDTSAPGAGASASVIEFLTTPFDFTASVNVTRSGTLSAVAGALNIAQGNRIGVDLNGTLTGLAGCLIIIELKPR